MKWIELERNSDGDLTEKTINEISDSFPVLILNRFGGENDVCLKESWGCFPDAYELHHTYYTHFCHIELPTD